MVIGTLLGKLEQRPSLFFHVLGYILLIGSFFSDWIAHYFPIIILCFIIAYFIEKKYTSIITIIVFYLIFWGVRTYLGGLWSLLLFIAVIGFAIFGKLRNFGEIFKEAETDKAAFELAVLEKLQKKDTPYMKELRDKIAKGKNKTNTTGNV